jgi:hypothetical protein
MNVSDPAPSPQPVQNPLTAIFTLKPEARDPGTLATGLAKLGALQRAGGILHFARILLLEKDTKLAVITTFDGDFTAYIHFFVSDPEIADAFDTFLDLVEGGNDCTPVSKNETKFAMFILQNNNPPSDPSDPLTLKMPPVWFSAYPEKTVPDILGADGGEMPIPGVSSGKSPAGPYA